MVNSASTNQYNSVVCNFQASVLLVHKHGRPQLSQLVVGALVHENVAFEVTQRQSAVLKQQLIRGS